MTIGKIYPLMKFACVCRDAQIQKSSYVRSLSVQSFAILTAISPQLNWTSSLSDRKIGHANDRLNALGHC